MEAAAVEAAAGDDSKVADSNGNGSPPSVVLPVVSLAISAGDEHTCAIVEGKAWCWGKNSDGQLGDNSDNQSSLPVAVVQTPADAVAGTDAVLLDSGVARISAGRFHTCAIHNGAAKCWGFNNSGQLGNGGAANSKTSVDVTGLVSDVTAISAGNAHTCAIHNDAAKCWGSDLNGKLGNGSSSSSSTPVPVTGLTSQVTAISAGTNHTCAVHNGAAKCWGNNEEGRLGDNAVTTGIGVVDTNFNRMVPVQVIGLVSGVTDISAGDEHTCAIHNGAAKCWGNNINGRLGDNTRTIVVSGGVLDPNNNRKVPMQVMGLVSDVTAISAGRTHTCAIHGGEAKCWGFGGSGRLGNGGTTESSTPMDVTGLVSDVTAISAGSAHTCALHNDAIKCWGLNGNGQLGTGSGNTTSSTPQTLSFEDEDEE